MANPTLTDNASSDPRFQGQQSIVGFSLRSIMAVPLNARDDLIGVVYCDNRIFAGVFKEQDLRLVADFANQSAIAIENAQLIESAQARLAEVRETSDLLAERPGIDCQRGHHHQRRTTVSTPATRQQARILGMDAASEADGPANCKTMCCLPHLMMIFTRCSIMYAQTQWRPGD